MIPPSRCRPFGRPVSFLRPPWFQTVYSPQANSIELGFQPKTVP